MKITRDSRKDKRVRMRVLLKYAPTAGGELIQVRNIHDISMGGLSFLLDQELAPETQLKISILFPSWRKTPIENIDAKVVNCLLYRKHQPPFRVGVQFLNLPEEKKNDLRSALGDLLKKRNKDSILLNFVIRKN